MKLREIDELVFRVNDLREEVFDYGLEVLCTTAFQPTHLPFSAPSRASTWPPYGYHFAEAFIRLKRTIREIGSFVTVRASRVGSLPKGGPSDYESKGWEKTAKPMNEVWRREIRRYMKGW